MARITISFNDDQADWIDTMSDDLERSKADIVRAGVNALRGETSPVLTELLNNGEAITGRQEVGDAKTVNSGEFRTADHRPTDREEQLAETVNELADRLADLEARQEDPKPAPADKTSNRRPSSEREPRGSGGENTTPPLTTDRKTAEPALSELEFPAGRDRDECIATIRAVREFIDENDSAGMREIVTNVMPAHPLGYDVPDLEAGDRYRGSWWRKIVKPGLSAYPDVKKPRGGGEWSIYEEDTTSVYDPTSEF